MRKFVNMVLILLLATATSSAQVDSVAADFTPGYLKAVSSYFGVPMKAAKAALTDGLKADELPVLFLISTNANASLKDAIAKRKDGQPWYKIAEAYGVKTSHFYVHLSKEPIGDGFIKLFKKFEGLSRTEYDMVKLSDVDLINLANLRFMYKHYNYSQHLIMTWRSENESYVVVNQMVASAAAEMKKAQASDND